MYLLSSGLEEILAVHSITVGLPQGRIHICLDLFIRCSTDSLSLLFGTFKNSECYIAAKSISSPYWEKGRFSSAVFNQLSHFEWIGKGELVGFWNLHLRMLIFRKKLTSYIFTSQSPKSFRRKYFSINTFLEAIIISPRYLHDIC